MFEDKTKENTPDFLKGLSMIAPTGDNIEQELDTYFKKSIKELATEDFNTIKNSITSNVRNGKYVVLKNGKKQIIETLYLHGKFGGREYRGLGIPRKLDEISKSKAEKIFLNHEIKATDNHPFVLAIYPIIDNKYNITFSKYSKIYLEAIKNLAEKNGLKLRFYYRVCESTIFGDSFDVEVDFDDYYNIKQKTLFLNPILKGRIIMNYTVTNIYGKTRLKTALRHMRRFIKNPYITKFYPTPIIEFTAEFD